MSMCGRASAASRPAFFRRRLCPWSLLPAIAVALAVSIAATPASAQEGRGGGLLPGGNSKEPIHIDAAKLDYFDKEQKLVYSGNVVATQGASKLKAQTLIIFLAPKEAGSPGGPPSSSSEVRRMEAEGSVTLTSKDQIGTGDRGIFEKSENKVYLIGNVTLSQGANVTKGDRLVYDLNTSQAVVTGRVRSMFQPDGGSQPSAKKKRAQTP